MPTKIEKEVTTTASGPVANQVTQSSTVTKTPTRDEVQDEQADKGNAWVWYIVGLIDLATRPADSSKI